MDKKKHIEKLKKNHDELMKINYNITFLSVEIFFYLGLIFAIFYFIDIDILYKIIISALVFLFGVFMVIRRSKKYFNKYKKLSIELKKIRKDLKSKNLIK